MSTSLGTSLLLVSSHFMRKHKKIIGAPALQ
jgi:hypothetical protein